ncbi:xylose isomerase [Tetragenococcus koreensis]|uniref:xylose isomerase n=1 Tax=Tetragenococcus koreensis TaxID=290335 RepID=UPI000F4ECA47|nr:xylose isomerase [Tetragenococcus koreensis]MDN6292625.1 xylose isomerase [Tetragenococcus halophilus]MDN6391961.1 xylose isomerase [Lactococcus lactis]MDN6630638.1 xylose isomerase [Staphylococcus equorum]AYW46529.1 xylose isomerase [Tetragenococcus koreensis]MCF1585353.1 xylose isomerase [Tetragenococcus koreensis]
MNYFESVPKIKYEGKDTDNKYAFRHYNPEEIILGKPMKDHLRFAVAFWHTMTEDGSDPFGDGTYQRNWEGNSPMDTAKNRVDAFFEILEKLDAEYFCFHDVDIAPQGDSLKEFFENIDVITDYIKEKMDKTGIKLLWNTANMFTHPRFVNGAATTNNADVYSIAAAQVKKGLDVSKKLNGENYVFWGGREGYENLLNTDMNFELDNLARFYRMVIDYAKSIDHQPQFLIEPKPKEPTKHQYDYDAATAMAFIQKYELENDFKLNLEANHAILAGHTFEHEINVARNYDSLGSLDANQGDLLLGWDTDEFPTDIYTATLAMYEVLENDGIAPGGINFDAKVRRTSFEMEDLVLAHIAGMDTYARGLRSAAKMKNDKFFEQIIEDRYASFSAGIGKQIIENKEDLESLTKYALSLNEVENKSGHIEHIKSLMNDYLV